MKYQSNSAGETEAIAAEFVRSFQGGEVVALHGELGAGKTQFVRGLVRGLGGEPRSVSSPTFVLLNIYDTGRLTVYHLDAYRTSGEDDFEGIGFAELLDQAGIVAVEWPQRVRGLLPSHAWHVTLTPLGESCRMIEITRDALQSRNV